MMRVLHVLPDLGAGGAQRMAVNLMSSLDRGRFEVGAVSLFDPQGTELEETLSRRGIRLWYASKGRGLDPRMFGRLDRLLGTFRPHVVHTHQYVLRYVLPSLVLRRTPVRVHTVHNVADREVDRPGQWLHRLAFKSGVLPVAIAPEVADSLESLYGLRGLPLIPNGIPVDSYLEPTVARSSWRRQNGFFKEDILFVCVARLSPQKNPLLLLEAFARGPASDARAHLLFVGEGSLREELERRVRDLDLAHQVHLLGLRRDVPEILGAADLFVLSSDWEGNPLCVMEAMSAGRPVIGTAVGGMPGLVEDGEHGVLVPPGDMEELQYAMERLMYDSANRERIGKACMERAVERFDVTAMAGAYEGLYEKIFTKSSSKQRNTYRPA